MTRRDPRDVTLKPLSHQSGRTPRCALCKRQQRCGIAVETLYNQLERHAAAFILSMLKTNAAAWRFHSVLDSTLWQRCGNAVGSSREPCARYERAASTL